MRVRPIFDPDDLAKVIEQAVKQVEAAQKTAVRAVAVSTHAAQKAGEAGPARGEQPGLNVAGTIQQVRSLTEALPHARDQSGRSFIQGAINTYTSQLRSAGVNVDALLAGDATRTASAPASAQAGIVGEVARAEAARAVMAAAGASKTAGNSDAPRVANFAAEQAAKEADRATRATESPGTRRAVEAIDESDRRRPRAPAATIDRPTIRRQRGNGKPPTPPRVRRSASPGGRGPRRRSSEAQGRLNDYFSSGGGQPPATTGEGLTPSPGDRPRQPARGPNGRPGFFSRPNAQGLYFSAMFGLSEAAGAARASGLAEANANYFPGNFDRQTTGYLKAYEQGQSGLLGSIAGLAIDPFGGRTARIGIVQESATSTNLMIEAANQRLRGERDERTRRRAPVVGSTASTLFGATEGFAKQLDAVKDREEERRANDEKQFAAERARIVERTSNAGANDFLKNSWATNEGAKYFGIVTAMQGGFLFPNPLRKAGELARAGAAEVDALAQPTAERLKSARLGLSAKERAQAAANFQTDFGRQIGTFEKDATRRQRESEMGDADLAVMDKQAVNDAAHAGIPEAIDAAGGVMRQAGVSEPIITAITSRATAALRLSKASQTAIDLRPYRRSSDEIASRLRSSARATMLDAGGRSFDSAREKASEAFREEQKQFANDLPEGPLRDQVIAAAREDFNASTAGIGASEENQRVGRQQAARAFDINLATRERSLGAVIDVSRRRRSPVAPGLEELVGGARSEIEQLRTSDNPEMRSRIPRVAAAARLAIDAQRSSFFAQFRPMQHESLAEVDTSGREFNRYEKDFARARDEIRQDAASDNARAGFDAMRSSGLVGAVIRGGQAILTATAPYQQWLQERTNRRLLDFTDPAAQQ